MNTIDWINGKWEETETDYRINGKWVLYKSEELCLKKGVELLCKKHKPKSVLEFGFGMGWTAAEFQKQDIERHVILEPNKENYRMALKWKKQFDDSDIEILNIFSWEFESDEVFDLVYDDRQEVIDEKKHERHMNKILPKEQWIGSWSILCNQKSDPNSEIYFYIDNKMYCQPLVMGVK